MSISERLAQVSRHFTGASTRDRLQRKSPDDIVITLALRTPLTKAKKGYLNNTQLEDILIPLLEGVRKRSGLDPAQVEEIVVGNVLHPAASYVARGSAFVAGFPPTTATSIVSRWCSSGLLAVQSVANQILSNGIDIGIAVGAESMSMNPDSGAPPLGTRIMNNPNGYDATMPMGWTSENVSGEFNITREMQDEFAATSFQKAEHAQKAGWPMQDEILPISVSWKDPKTGELKQVLATQDDGPRYGTTAESLSKIRPAFPQWKPAQTTGGNASQITDGAAAVVLMRRSTAERLGQPILAKYVGSTVVGLEPRIMGIGPTYAIPKLMQRFEFGYDDVDIFEINEAFASMAVYCRDTLKIDPEKLNPRGGAIALGHPLGCTGARQIVTAIAELKRTGKKTAVTSMCVGTGMGMASLIVAE